MAGALRFHGTIRYFRPVQQGGLAVIDIPHNVAMALGGLKQMRVRGLMNGTEFTSNTMPAGGRVLALSVSRRLLADAQLHVGDEADIEVERL